LVRDRVQGSHFTSPRYLDRLLAREIQISMDGRGWALDNVFVERLWRSVKKEPSTASYRPRRCRCEYYRGGRVPMGLA
jgi:transposase InsO family protein